MKRRLVSLAFVAALTLVVPVFAAPTPRVTWSEVAVREGDDSARLAKLLGKQLSTATRRAEWKAKRKPPSATPALTRTANAEASAKSPSKPAAPVPLSAKVLRFDWSQASDVVHLDVAALGRIARGPTVRTKIRLSGKPNERSKLEKDALRLVAEGLVARLAEIVRRR
ncbi:MAG: hypothetical protein FJ095_11425 [Deltaproteobacteria bacterium]|nr:hypothetical protein [Deltaproteobacteria bacterium]